LDIPSGSTPPTSSDATSLRVSLAEAQKARSALEIEIAAFSPLRQENKRHQKTIERLNRELLGLQRKLKDRAEELQAKKKMIENVQDEMISQQIELNMCEEKLTKLQRDNKDLVARWMEKKGEEADQMNLQSNW
jgi:septal ring factor EnvC (AmiA/AmiB activator)